MRIVMNKIKLTILLLLSCLNIIFINTQHIGILEKEETIGVLRYKKKLTYLSDRIKYTHNGASFIFPEGTFKKSPSVTVSLQLNEEFNPNIIWTPIITSCTSSNTTIRVTRFEYSNSGCQQREANIGEVDVIIYALG